MHLDQTQQTFCWTIFSTLNIELRLAVLAEWSKSHTRRKQLKKLNSVRGQNANFSEIAEASAGFQREKIFCGQIV